MNQEEFHKHYEEEAEKIFTALSEIPEDSLVKIIQDKRDTPYHFWKGEDQYQIWRVFKQTGTEKSIRPLYEVVSNMENEYLVRYHACDALFVIAGIEDGQFKGEVQYGLNAKREPVDQQKAIHKLGVLLKLIH